MPITPEDAIKINSMTKAFGQTLINAGFNLERNAFSNLIPVNQGYGWLTDTVANATPIPVVIRDVRYFSTTKENLIACCDLIWGIVKNFKWQAENRDCDDRAKLVSALFSLLFGLNTCGELYCAVKSLSGTGFTGNHYNNLLVSSEGSILIFDVDNQGLVKEIFLNQPISFGYWSYTLMSARF